MHERPHQGLIGGMMVVSVRPFVRLGAQALAVAGLIVSYLPTFRTLWTVWLRNPNYSHGFLIPPVAAWLLWRQRRVFSGAERSASWMGTVLLVPAAILQLVGLRGDVAMLQGLSLILVLGGMTWQFYGRRAFLASFFPIAFLIFMIPALPWFMDVLSFKLKILAALSAVSVAQTMGVAVQREGVNLLFPGGILAVEGACSGLRSLLALLALGALFSYLSGGALWRRILLFAMALPIAVAANIVRISSLCVYAGFAGVEKAAGIFHEIGGYTLFVLAFVMLAAGKKVLRC